MISAVQRRAFNRAHSARLRTFSIGDHLRLDADLVQVTTVEAHRVGVQFADGAQLWVSNLDALTTNGDGGIST